MRRGLPLPLGVRVFEALVLHGCEDRRDAGVVLFEAAAGRVLPRVDLIDARVADLALHGWVLDPVALESLAEHVLGKAALGVLHRREARHERFVVLVADRVLLLLVIRLLCQRLLEGRDVQAVLLALLLLQVRLHFLPEVVQQENGLSVDLDGKRGASEIVVRHRAMAHRRRGWGTRRSAARLNPARHGPRDRALERRRLPPGGISPRHWGAVHLGLSPGTSPKLLGAAGSPPSEPRTRQANFWRQCPTPSSSSPPKIP
mmetsp:Transcript_5521/g.13405  ORF Transcript_5521/g.13405 Transcript_5521/m.13405 type:complete len:259 (-) Transcript_5521:124-900(-)